jgi:acyl-CoA thioesterase FadM
MYPIIRVIKELYKNRNAPDLSSDGTHVSWHRCWPQDIDMFLEMNNGRIPTIMELGRFGLAQRVGLIKTLKDRGWGLTVAGTSIRYRKRIKPFVRFKMHSKAVCWDARFIYIAQSIWIGDDCAAHALFRTGVVSKGKLVPTHDVFTATKRDAASPPTPDWVQNWIDAEATRPWPPEQI